MAGGPGMDFSFLTRRHAIRIVSNANVEVCSLAVGEVIGHDNVLSASRMNNAVVCFLKTVEMANDIIEGGLVINGEFTSALPLSMPAKKVILSNVPPFVSDGVLIDTLSRYGKIVSPIRKINIASKSPLLRHVVSFRRSVYMICKGELDLKLNVKVDDFNYGIFVTTDSMKCLGCGLPGHFLRACPRNQKNADKGDTSVSVGAGETVEPVADTSGVGNGEGGEANDSGDQEKMNNGDETTESGVPETVGVENDAQTEAGLSKEKTDESGDKENNGDGEDTDVDEHLSTQLSVSSLTGERSTDFPDISFKEPLKTTKRKSTRMNSGKAKKTDLAITRNDTESESEFSDYSITCSLQPSGYTEQSYTVDDIKYFLAKTKHSRNVRVDEYFPNVELFINQTKTFIGAQSFTDPEVFRLRKILTKLNILLNDGNNPDNA